MMKVMVFIDNSNLYKEICNKYGKELKLDYEKLKNYISSVCLDNYKTEMTILFCVYASERRVGGTPQSGFYKKLQYIGYNVNIFELHEVKPGVFAEDGVVDIALSVDMAIGAARNFYDIAVLVAGDGGYAYLADAVRSQGKMIDIIFPESSLSDDLRRRAHYFVPINAAVVEKIKLVDMENNHDDIKTAKS
jgi:uncharacterized LabA/DUF88 family protein